MRDLVKWAKRSIDRLPAKDQCDTDPCDTDKVLKQPYHKPGRTQITLEQSCPGLNGDVSYPNAG
jgi:hypothetical protein